MFACLMTFLDTGICRMPAPALTNRDIRNVRWRSRNRNPFLREWSVAAAVDSLAIGQVMAAMGAGRCRAMGSREQQRQGILRIETSEKEREILGELESIDRRMMTLRNQLRQGERLS